MNVNQRLTNHAIDILDHFEGGVVSAHEELSHDGYDDMGPESDLWDLKITTVDGRVWWYHREWWFNGPDDDEYELVQVSYLAA